MLGLRHGHPLEDQAMRYIVAVVGLALCAGVSAQGVKLDTDSAVTVRQSIESRSSSNGSSSSSSITSSVNADTGVSTSSIIGMTGSMCSTVVEGKRCEVTCQAPQVAQCGKGA